MGKNTLQQSVKNYDAPATASAHKTRPPESKSHRQETPHANIGIAPALCEQHRAWEACRAERVVKFFGAVQNTP